MTLPADVARCIGTDLPECTTCRRRSDTHLPTGVRIYGTRVADAIRARGSA
jgi:hypothetical protein